MNIHTHTVSRKSNENFGQATINSDYPQSNSALSRTLLTLSYTPTFLKQLLIYSIITSTLFSNICFDLRLVNFLG